MIDGRDRERHALMRRLVRLAGPDGIAGGFMSDGAAYIVESRTLYSDPTPQPVGPKSARSLRVQDGILYATLADGTEMKRGPGDAEWGMA